MTYYKCKGSKDIRKLMLKLGADMLLNGFSLCRGAGRMTFSQLPMKHRLHSSLASN